MGSFRKFQSGLITKLYVHRTVELLKGHLIKLKLKHLKLTTYSNLGLNRLFRVEIMS